MVDLLGLANPGLGYQVLVELPMKQHSLTSWDDKPLVAFIVVLNFHLLDYILSIPVQDDGCPVASASTGLERLLHPLPNFLSCSPVGQREHCHGSTRKGLYTDS